MCRDGRKSKSPDSRFLRNIRHVGFFAPTISAISLATLGFSAIQTFIILFCSLNEETRNDKIRFSGRVLLLLISECKVTFLFSFFVISGQWPCRDWGL